MSGSDLSGSSIRCVAVCSLVRAWRSRVGLRCRCGRNRAGQRLDPALPQRASHPAGRTFSFACGSPTGIDRRACWQARRSPSPGVKASTLKKSKWNKQKAWQGDKVKKVGFDDAGGWAVVRGRSVEEWGSLGFGRNPRWTDTLDLSFCLHR